MKVKDIPEKIGKSETVGELLNLKVIKLLIDELTNESYFKTKVLNLIEVREYELMEFEV